MNEKKKDYDIVAILRPDMERLRELFGQDITDEQVRAQLQRALDEVNATVQSYKHMCMFVLREQEFPKNSSKKIKRAGLAEEIEKEYLSRRGG